MQPGQLHADDAPALEAVMAPAFACIAVGAFQLVSSLGFGVAALLGWVDMPWLQGATISDLIAIPACSVVWAGFGALAILAGSRIRTLEGHTQAVVACAAMLTPITFLPCCFLGLPVAVWTLLVINREPVQSAFARRKTQLKSPAPTESTGQAVDRSDEKHHRKAGCLLAIGSVLIPPIALFIAFAATYSGGSAETRCDRLISQFPDVVLLGAFWSTMLLPIYTTLLGLVSVVIPISRTIRFVSTLLLTTIFNTCAWPMLRCSSTNWRGDDWWWSAAFVVLPNAFMLGALVFSWPWFRKAKLIASELSEKAHVEPRINIP